MEIIHSIIATFHPNEISRVGLLPHNLAAETEIILFENITYINSKIFKEVR